MRPVGSLGGMAVDPLTVKCPKDGCGALKGQRCVRLGGYGTGHPLRRAHSERYAAARWRPVRWQR